MACHPVSLSKVELKTAWVSTVDPVTRSVTWTFQVVLSVQVVCCGQDAFVDRVNAEVVVPDMVVGVAPET
jgi:hypothetical protein